MSNSPRTAIPKDGGATGDKTPPNLKKWPSWAPSLLVVTAIICFLVGLAQYHQYQNRLVPNLPSGSKHTLSTPEVVA
jgi:hypothetical protein